MKAQRNAPIAPKDPTDEVKVQRLDRKMVWGAVATIALVIIFAVIISGESAAKKGDEKTAGQANKAAVVESGSTPEILRDDPGAFAGRLDALSRARQATAQEGGGGSSDAPSGAAPDSVEEAKAKAMEAIMERMRQLREQKDGGSARLQPTSARPGGAGNDQRNFYRNELARRQREGTLGRGASQGSQAASQAEQRRQAAIASSPIVMNTAGEQSSSVEVETTGNREVDMLRSAQQMAAKRGDGTTAQMLASLASMYENETLTGLAEEGGVPGGTNQGGSAALTRAGGSGYAASGYAAAPASRAAVQIESPLTPYEIKQGTVIPAILETAINSDMPGGVRARTTRDVFDSRVMQHILIPKNSTLVGTAGSSASRGDARMAVAWDRVILPDGRSINLGGQETKDGSGASGMTGDVDRHFFRRFGSALLVSMVGAGVKIATYDEGGFGGFSRPDPKQVVGSSAAEQTGDVANEMLRRSMNVAPTVRIPAGQPFNVFVNRDMAFHAPYQPADGFNVNW